MSDTEYQPVSGVEKTKRASVARAPWMGDWFVSHSPRNDNSHAEGPWDHWVQVALSILQHPATAIVRPEAHQAVSQVANTSFYSETGRALTDEELEALFGTVPRG